MVTGSRSRRVDPDDHPKARLRSGLPRGPAFRVFSVGLVALFEDQQRKDGCAAHTQVAAPPTPREGSTARLLSQLKQGDSSLAGRVFCFAAGCRPELTAGD